MEFLKKIRLVGFKSFADETIIECGPGITAVVGPNGCGKSNILDAVRWVLGERSPKGLRAKSMEDVIFLGSETRNSGGFAEVEIYFNNTNRLLSLDQDEVSIGRRVFVSSGSEYLLNGRRVPRKEIEKVLMDTGIGKTAYSIMEQGRMSEILKASPEDRRILFDEAAGVSRFKAEREETLERLKATEQNLLRLDDILKGKREEIDHLEKQAKKTRQYLKLKEHLDKSDKKLRYIQYRDLAERKNAGVSKLGDLTKKRDELMAAIAEREKKSEDLANLTENESEEMHRLDRDYHQAIARLESLNRDKERVAGEVAGRDQKMQTLVGRKQAEEKNRTSIEKKYETSTQLELNLGAEIEALKDAALRLEEVISKRETQIRKYVEQEEANQNELRKSEAEQEHLVSEMRRVTDELVQELEAKQKDIVSHEAARKKLNDAFAKEADTTIERLAALEQKLKASDTNGAKEILSKLKIAELRKLFDEADELDAKLRGVLFGKTGLLTRKEQLDVSMEQIRKRRDQLQKENAGLFEKRKQDLSQNEKDKNRKIEIELEIRSAEERLKSSSQGLESIRTQLEEIKERITYLAQEVNEAKSALDRLKEEEKEVAKEIAQLRKSSDSQKNEMEGMRGKIERKHKEINDLKEKYRRDREQLDRVLPAIGEQERLVEHIGDDIRELVENLYNDFQTDIQEIENEFAGDASKFKEQEAEFRRIRQEIQSLGQFNALAIEELGRATEAHDLLMDQRKDIEAARKNILEVLHETDARSREIFLDNFLRIQNNFQEVFQSLFGGGKASLSLTNPEDPLQGGVEIMVQPPGKKNSSITLLSGGEQNMTAIALMFATYLVRPSPFCFLDEIDAPLDENNVLRFLRMLGTFVNRSQFLVITHCKQTMARASNIFGVTQEEAGVSRIVSVQLTEAARSG
ncbi:MAG: AAA family ATPase [Leptospirales bacterium]|nr:AAA family ATPase [Leptospirales bacterium]